MVLFHLERPIRGCPTLLTFVSSQAVIQGAFTSEDAVETEATATETHYTYYPATAVADTSTSAGAGTTATAVVTTQNSDALLGQATPTGTGQSGWLVCEIGQRSFLWSSDKPAHPQ